MKKVEEQIKVHLTGHCVARCDGCEQSGEPCVKKRTALSCKACREGGLNCSNKPIWQKIRKDKKDKIEQAAEEASTTPGRKGARGNFPCSKCSRRFRRMEHLIVM